MRSAAESSDRARLRALVGSICVGCGCTDECACEGGCLWLVRDGHAGVCSTCRRVLPQWAQGARLVGFLQDWPAPAPRVFLGDRRLQEYRALTNQVLAPYFVLDEERATVRIVDNKGRPWAAAGEELLRIDYSIDWAEVAKAKSASLPRRRGDAPDAKRGQQLKTERARARAKAASKARQTQRRRG